MEELQSQAIGFDAGEDEEKRWNKLSGVSEFQNEDGVAQRLVGKEDE